jgi:GNAT superfamily N-acetyltransferase
MEITYLRLIEEKREALWIGQQDFSGIFNQAGATPGASAYGPIEHLSYIKERRGEKIVAVESGSQKLLGWIGLFPDRDEGGLFYNLAGIEVHADFRGRGIGAGLMEEAGKYIQRHKTARLKFGTSPLLTHCAALFVTRFGTRYRWKEGVRISDGRPWPYVSCECDFDDPLFKPLDLRDEEVGRRSVLDWEGSKPAARKGIVFSGPLAVVLPSLSALELAEAVGSETGFLETLYSVFESLVMHGYGFAWFDRTVLAGVPRFYYVMNRLMAL